MDLLESHMILKLKSRLFDMIDPDKGLLKYDNLIEEMLGAIRCLMKASEVNFYCCNEWNEKLVVESSTNRNFKNTFIPRKISCTEFEKLAQKNSVYRDHFPFPGFETDDLFLFIHREGNCFGLLTLKEDIPSSFDHFSDEFLRELSEQCGIFLIKIQSLARIVIEKKRYKQLFRVTEKFHSSMKIDDVLGEIIYTLQEVYPTFTYYLLLSHDNNSHGDLPIKDLEYDSENIAAMQAYVTGTIQFEDSLQEKRSVLYAPLKGKQGVYGVLQVIAPNSLVFPKNEVEFITLLANTAGGALENAQLYQQSRKLIADLQLINETSQRLNSNLRLTEMMTFMSEQIISSFDAQEVGFIILLEDNEKYDIVKGSTSFFFTEPANYYIKYIKNKIQKEKDSLFIGDLNLQLEITRDRFRSIMAVPMVQSEKLKGFTLVMHSDPYHFSFETFKLLQSLIHHSTLALTNSMLREELERMVVTDHLTKLYSRNYLDERIHLSMAEDDMGTFILVDIDNFKLINDTYGHQVGDEILVQVANMILGNIRDTDIGARWGGEELAIYLPRVSIEKGALIAERLVKKVSENTNPPITISCGVSYWTSGSDDTLKSLFKRADKALYIAKGTGKNKVVIQEEDTGLKV
ncbi:signal transduction diguanylate cyclase [Bacillus methanolicus PB1]|uniref:Signal transduction diguanylate cyclase n=1 Tax=Bacillus methanolicus PB1 TaxID=997296 RepID=I3DYG3_BACMT|nr:diguanylate cyclase [Bacillus methanolicus]EIJ79284.1 signal transduction diguanylate cyclase [Bacillus methanolicus PB1]